MIASVALFTSLGGVGYAAATIGSAQIKDNSIQGKDIRNGQVKSADMARNAVTSGTVRNGSLLAADFKAGQLRVGPQGPARGVGPTGDRGTNGTNGTNGAPGTAGTARAYGYIRANGTFDPARSKNVTATAPAGPGGVCVTVTGASALTTGAVATSDWDFSNSSPTKIAHVEWRSVSPNCASTSDFEFRTTVVTANGANLVNAASSEPFFFIVP
ncbi:hypothetical protein BH20ACT16_BH20ACT16_05530 [soil metagenome]